MGTSPVNRLYSFLPKLSLTKKEERMKKIYLLLTNQKVESSEKPLDLVYDVNELKIKKIKIKTLENLKKISNKYKNRFCWIKIKNGSEIGRLYEAVIKSDGIYVEDKETGGDVFYSWDDLHYVNI